MEPLALLPAAQRFGQAQLPALSASPLNCSELRLLVKGKRQNRLRSQVHTPFLQCAWRIRLFQWRGSIPQRRHLTLQGLKSI